MGPGDLLPSELSKYFGFDLFYLIIIVLFFGFITLRLSQKYGSLDKDLKSLDEIFLITLMGLAIAFRLHWLYRMWIPAITKPELFLSFWLVPLFSVLVTILVIMVSIYDAEIVLKRRILSRKEKTKLLYKTFKLGRQKRTAKEIDKNINITRFNVLIVGSLLILAMIYDIGEINVGIIMASLSLLFSFSPIISISIILYNRLTK